MAISSISNTSGTNNVYASNTATANNTKGTLSITSYFKLLAAQLANQDMSNPMDTSDMMNQMSQMAMVQSLTAMTDSIKSSTALSQQSYAASLVGKRVSYLAADGSNPDGTERTAVKSGIITSVNLSGDNPTFQVKGEKTSYELSRIQSIHENDEVKSTDTAEKSKD